MNLSPCSETTSDCLFAFGDRTVASGSDVRTSRATTFDSFSLDFFRIVRIHCLTDLSRFFPFSAAFLWHNHPFAIWAPAMIAFQELEIVSRECVMFVA